MGKQKVGALEKIDADLVNLQYKIRRDPKSYRDDFLSQYDQYQSQRDIFMSSPNSTMSNGIVSFYHLIDFVAHVADHFPAETSCFSDDLKLILELHHTQLAEELREKIVGSLALLRRKKLITSEMLLALFFPMLISTPSKIFRTLLYQKILSDLRTSNSKVINHRLNRMMQNEFFNLLTSDRSSPKGIWVVKITRELWKRRIWTDATTVEIMREASVADNLKVIGGGVRFFLANDQGQDELDDESSDNEVKIDLGRLRHQAGINKKRKRSKKDFEDALKKVKKQEKKKKAPPPLNFSAVHFLHDPQSFAEMLFSKHLQNTRSKLNLEQKLIVLQLVSRLVGLHKLCILSLYSYFAKFLTPRQPSVTSFLASLAQSTHSLVPPDALEPLIQKIANEFVSEASACEVATAGLNAIREICARQPLAMGDTLLQDLVMYRKSKDKGTMMAAKGLLSLYREVGADLLRKKDRGKSATINIKTGKLKERRFGEETVGEIEGLDLLEKWKENERKSRRSERDLASDSDNFEFHSEVEEERGWENWEVESDISDRLDGWINVESDTEIKINDSEEEQAFKKFKPENCSGEQEETSQLKNEQNQKSKSLATTRILTPADLAKLKELRLSASLNDKSRLNIKNTMSATNNPKSISDKHPDDAITAESIEGLSRLRKATKEEMLAKAREGKAERSAHKSTQALRRQTKDFQGKSSTNKEKARRKNFMMTLSKAKTKQKRSLVQTRKVLKCHIERSKRDGRRGNVGM